jgi:hypothetical protein
MSRNVKHGMLARTRQQIKNFKTHQNFRNHLLGEAFESKIEP